MSAEARLLEMAQKRIDELEAEVKSLRCKIEMPTSLIRRGIENCPMPTGFMWATKLYVRQAMMISIFHELRKGR